jgi:hypothetical protein
MELSEVSPNNGSTDEPRVTGKNNNVKHMFPTSPNLSANISNFSCHLSNFTTKQSNKHQNINIGLINSVNTSVWFNFKEKKSLTLVKIQDIDIDFVMFLKTTT